MSNQITVRELTPTDRQWLAVMMAERWGGEIVVTRGQAHRVAELPGFVAEIEGERVGVATYRMTEVECELVTINALRRRIGIGTTLLAAVEAAAGNRRFWLITTNDNVDAMRFYQRRGLVLAAAHPEAMEESRRIKPQSPRLGCYGSPIRDELEFFRPR